MTQPSFRKVYQCGALVPSGFEALRDDPQFTERVDAILWCKAQIGVWLSPEVSPAFQELWIVEDDEPVTYACGDDGELTEASWVTHI